jgi:predicted alpha/beta superfamily hydrolase
MQCQAHAFQAWCRGGRWGGALLAGALAGGALLSACTPTPPPRAAGRSVETPASGEAGAASDATEPTITFQVEVPETTPPDAALWICGDHPRLGAWDGRGLRAARHADGTYAARCAFAPGTTLQFKVTRGDWATVEKSAAGAEIANRLHTVAGPETLLLRVGAWRDQIEPAPNTRSHTLTGTIREHRAFSSRFLEHARDVLVYLPPRYETDSELRYPVLYMHDGQNVFDAATAFIGIEWGVDETAERQIAAGEITPLIIVAVANSPARVTEYTPVADANRGGGGAAVYGRFLTEELKPFIDRTYRTLPEAAHTGVAGSSLGGLVSLHLALAHAETFGRIGAVSPSVHWAGEEIVARVAQRGHTGARIWVDMGTSEGRTAEESARAIAAVRRLRDALEGAGWTLGADLHYLEAAGAIHNEAAWAERVAPILRFLFPPTSNRAR